MAREIDDALTETRIIIQDAVTPYRVSDAEMIRYLNNSLAEIRRLRPDIWLSVAAATDMYDVPEYTEAQLGTSEPYPLHDMYFPASVNYMVSMVESRDDQSIGSGRANSFMTLFMAQIKGA